MCLLVCKHMSGVVVIAAAPFLCSVLRYPAPPLETDTYVQLPQPQGKTYALRGCLRHRGGGGGGSRRGCGARLHLLSMLLHLLLPHDALAALMLVLDVALPGLDLRQLDLDVVDLCRARGERGVWGVGGGGDVGEGRRRMARHAPLPASGRAAAARTRHAGRPLLVRALTRFHTAVVLMRAGQATWLRAHAPA